VATRTYRTIISDIDGTLIPVNSAGYPTRRVTAAIRKALADGVVFTLATGRSFALVEPLVKYLNLPYPLITDNGAVIQSSDGTVFWEENLPREEALDILGMVTSCPLVAVGTDGGRIENSSAIPWEARIRKISLHGITVREAERLVKLIERDHTDLAVVRDAVDSGPGLTAIYIASQYATKQHAVLKFAQIHGLKTDDIVGIGDGVNDFPLLMACGFKVAMGNALDDLKAVADYVAPDIAADGLAHVLETFMA
jgi:Cof subfamily protein (haloacid dehalogenase superfamily)